MFHHSKIEIRRQSKTDKNDVDSIIACASEELRSIYRPSSSGLIDDKEKYNHIVAMMSERVVGTAEYLICENSIKVRGIAVSPAFRKQGVARAMIDYIMLVLQKEAKNELCLSTIKETGNMDVFLCMGFVITSEEISVNFEGIQGQKVTLVNMKKINNK